MKYLRLLLKNVFRNKVRTLVTMASIAASLFLVATLLSVLEGLYSPPETSDSALRLITRHKTGIFNVLPIAHAQKIAQVEGVEAITPSMWFGGVYKDPANFFAQFAVDAEII